MTPLWTVALTRLDILLLDFQTLRVLICLSQAVMELPNPLRERTWNSIGSRLRLYRAQTHPVISKYRQFRILSQATQPILPLKKRMAWALPWGHSTNGGLACLQPPRRVGVLQKRVGPYLIEPKRRRLQLASICRNASPSWIEEKQCWMIGKRLWMELMPSGRRHWEGARRCWTQAARATLKTLRNLRSKSTLHHPHVWYYQDLIVQIRYYDRTSKQAH